MNPPRDDTRFDGDGTHGASASDTFADPLFESANEYGEPKPAREGTTPAGIAAPVAPDTEAVQRMVSAAMDEQQEPAQPGTDLSGAEGPEAPRTPAAVQPEQPLGMIGQQRRNWPAGRVLRSGLRAGGGGRQFKVPKPALRVNKPSSGSAGVIIAVVLLLVFVIVLIATLSSMIDTISSLFG